MESDWVTTNFFDQIISAYLEGSPETPSDSQEQKQLRKSLRSRGQRKRAFLNEDLLIKIVEENSQRNPPLEVTDRLGRNLLMYSVWSNLPRLFSILIQHNYDVNQKDN